MPMITATGFPPRDYAESIWLNTVRPYYANTDVLKCSVDKQDVDYSYLMNGFTDYYLTTAFEGDWNRFFGAYKTGELPSMKLGYIQHPAETITFGEKHAEEPRDDPYMDMWPLEYGNDISAGVDHAKHGKENGRSSGGSNHAFADGSVRYLKFGSTVDPVNQWAVTDVFRNALPPDIY